jgi:hypothetical protein
MNSLILFQQLLVLLALMLTGYIAYRTNLIDDHTHEKLSSLMVWILNPFLMISGVIGKNSSISQTLILQNVIMVGILYGIMFLIGFAYVAIVGCKGPTGYLYRMVLLFPNAGFMGIPLVKEIFGSEYIVLVAFYVLCFNVLCYSYGIHLAARLGGKQEKFDLKKLISPGTITSLLAILIFALHVNIPAPVVSYVDYLGNMCIPVSMLIIGVSLAKIDWKTAFAKKDYYIFLIADMFVIPLILVFASRFLPFDSTVIGVFRILACMPVASMTCMMAQEYGGDGTECAKLIALTTICTVITAPLVILIAG